LTGYLLGPLVVTGAIAERAYLLAIFGRRTGWRLFVPMAVTLATILAMLIVFILVLLRGSW
jgi:hypothetical protein